MVCKLQKGHFNWPPQGDLNYCILNLCSYFDTNNCGDYFFNDIRKADKKISKPTQFSIIKYKKVKRS